MEWMRYLASRLYLAMCSYWAPQIPPIDDPIDEESMPTYADYYNYEVPPAPPSSPVGSQDLTGFEFEEEWIGVE